MNRKLIAAVALAAVVGTPVAAFAQSSPSGITRADVIADLIQAERDGTSRRRNGTTRPAHRRSHATASCMRLRMASSARRRQPWRRREAARTSNEAVGREAALR